MSDVTDEPNHNSKPDRSSPPPSRDRFAKAPVTSTPWAANEARRATGHAAQRALAQALSVDGERCQRAASASFTERLPSSGASHPRAAHARVRRARAVSPRGSRRCPRPRCSRSLAPLTVYGETGPRRWLRVDVTAVLRERRAQPSADSGAAENRPDGLLPPSRG